MNFLSKTLFKQVLPQFLQIDRDSLEMAQGTLKLAGGQLKRDRINVTLSQQKLQLTASRYQDIQLEIPWFEFAKRAVRADIGRLQLQLAVADSPNEPEPIGGQCYKRQQSVGSKGLVKSYLMRIAGNIQVTIRELKVSMQLPQGGGCWSVSLQGFSAKNSNLYMQQNSSVRKTILIERVLVDRNGLEVVKVDGMSFCLDVDDDRLKLLAVVDNVLCRANWHIATELRLMGIKAATSPSKRAAEHNTQTNKNVGVFLKVEQCSGQFELQDNARLNFLMRSWEIEGTRTCGSSGESLQLRVALREASILGCDKLLARVYNGAAAGQFITAAEHEQKTVRGVEFHVSMLAGEAGTKLTAKLYQMGADIHLGNISQVVRSLSHQTYESISLLVVRQPGDQLEQPSGPQVAPVRLSVQFVLYKCLLAVTTGEHSLSCQLSVDGGNSPDGLACRLLQLSASMSHPSLKWGQIHGAQLILKDGDLLVLVPYISIKVHALLVRIFLALGADARSIGLRLSKVFAQGIKAASAEGPKKSEAAAYVSSVYLSMDDLYVSIGSLLVGRQHRFATLLQLYASQLSLKLRDQSLQTASVKMELIYVDQQTLLEERLSNTLQLAYSTKENNEKLLEFKNSTRLRVDIQQVMAMQRLLQQQPTGVVLSNHTSRTIRILQQDYACELLAYASCSWFIFHKCFRLHSKEASSPDIQLNFQSANDQTVSLSDRSQLVLRLVRLPNGQHDVQICASSYLLNCAFDLSIRHPRLGICREFAAAELTSVDFELAEQPIDKVHDFSEFGQFFSDSNLQELQLCWMGRPHHLQLMMQSDQKHYYAVRDRQHNHHSGYIFVKGGASSLLFVAMPFLAVKNQTDLDLSLVVTQKKSQVEFRSSLRQQGEVIPQPTAEIDFYLKQFVVQVQLESLSNNIDRELVEAYSSEQYYFSTFAFVSEPIERVIPLRSTAKQRYDKKHLCIRESVKLRTKVLEFACGLHIRNDSGRGLVMTVRQRNLVLEPVRLPPKSSTVLPAWLRSDDQLTFELEGDSRVKVQFQDISACRQLLSFNFCKVGESFRNVLVLIQLLKEDRGHQTLHLQDLVGLTNLTQTPFVVDGATISPEGSAELAIPPNLLNEFNNKAIKMDSNYDEVYRKLFGQEHHQNLEEHGFDIRPEDSLEAVNLYRFTRQTIFEVTAPACKRVYRLLKDLSKRINFYLIEDVHSPDSHYTLVNNLTDRHFLLSQAPKFSGIFEQPVSTPQPQLAPLKVLVQPETSSVVLRRTDQSIFLCDGKGERLNELKPSLLDKIDIRCQKNLYGLLALVQFRRKSPLLNHQLRVKHCEVILLHEGQQVLSVSLKNLNVRKLEDNKYDLLLKELTIRDAVANIPVFSLPDQTYLILELSLVHSNVLLIRNMFLKIKRIIVDVRKDFFMGLIRLNRSLRQPLKEAAEPTKESFFLAFVRSPLVLVKNIFIDEFEIALSLQIETIELRDQLQVPAYKLINAAYRQKKLMSELEKHYSSAIVAKFPKLSFIIQNVKHPFSSIRSLFSLRESLRHRQQQLLQWRSCSNPTHSEESLVERQLIPLVPGEAIVASMRLQGDRRLFLTQRRFITAKGQQFSSTPLEKIRQVNLQLRRDCLIAQLTLFGTEELLQINMGRRLRCPLLALLQSVIV